MLFPGFVNACLNNKSRWITTAFDEGHERAAEASEDTSRYLWAGREILGGVAIVVTVRVA